MAYMEGASCVKCDALIYEVAGQARTPCPVCGAIARRFDVILEDLVAFYDGTRVKGYRSGSSKFFIDMRDGPSYYRMADQWHHLVRIIDRENDRYTETVKVLSTGELISHVDEPLSHHVGHGGSKNQGEKS